MVDPNGPEIIDYVLVSGAAAYTEAGRYSGNDEIVLDIGVCSVTLVPGQLVV